MDSSSEWRTLATPEAAYIYNLGLAFYQTANRFASHVALCYPTGQTVTYDQLNKQSNRLARLLIGKGVNRGDVVCIFNNKSFDAIACILACLKIGAVYTNLDVSSPEERLQKMLGTCQPVLLILDNSDIVVDLPQGSETPLLELSSGEFERLLAAEDDSDLDATASITGADPAYIMFTSGSTGFPKGAVMSHGNVLNLIRWAQTTFAITPDDRLTNVNPIYFDNSVFDLYSSLFSGASLCPVTTDITQDAAKLVDIINRLECTLWFSVPSLLVYLLTMRALQKDDFPAMKRIGFGGEGFPKAKLKELYSLFGGRAQLVNVYGPTECTCICSSYPITEADVEDQSQLAPLGHLAPNFGHYIDPLEESNPQFGELLLSGPSVGLGYYNDQERTQRAFVQHPADNRCRNIMYRTGDLVRLAGDGRLHFCGRMDNQIKHMGYRIELEEVEAAFNSLDYVDEVGVVYKQLQEGLGQIIAFVNCEAEVPQQQLSGDVKAILPPYMVPKRINVIGALPKNANGKIDRVKLKELA